MNWKNIKNWLRMSFAAAAARVVAGAADPRMFPHSVCLRGNASLIALHISSDLLVATAYVVIPACAAMLVVRAMASNEYRDYLLSRKLTPVAILSAAFILACGAGHAMSALTFYYPIYWFEGWWKPFTAMVSLATALVLAMAAFHNTHPAPQGIEEACDTTGCTRRGAFGLWTVWKKVRSFAAERDLTARIDHLESGHGGPSK
jgi:hypothetical protein